MFDCLPFDHHVEQAPPVVHECYISSKNSWNKPLNEIAEEHLATMSPEELDHDWKLNEFFGTIAIINLPKESERLKRVTKQLKAIGVYDYEVFAAIDGRKELDSSVWKKFRENRLGKKIDNKNKSKALEKLHKGEAGCYMSHYLLIKRMKAAFDQALNELYIAEANHNEQGIANAEMQLRKYSRILILEDDNGFGIVNSEKTDYSRQNTGKIFREALKTLPKDWDMLYLMCAAHQKSKEISPHLRQIKRSVFMNAYVVNYTMYESILSTLEQIEDPKVKEIMPVDKMISFIHYLHKVYAVYPSIAFQFDGVSTIDSTSKQTLTQCQPVLKSG